MGWHHQLPKHLRWVLSLWFDLPLGGSALAEEVPTWGRCRKSICWWASTIGWKGGGMSIGQLTLVFTTCCSSGWMVPTRGLRILTIHETSFYSLKKFWSPNVVKQFWQQFEVLPGKLTWFPKNHPIGIRRVIWTKLRHFQVPAVNLPRV